MLLISYPVYTEEVGPVYVYITYYKKYFTWAIGYNTKIDNEVLNEEKWIFG